MTFTPSIKLRLETSRMVMVWHLDNHRVLAMCLAKTCNVIITLGTMFAMKPIGRELQKFHWKKENNLLLVQPLFIDIVSLHQFALQGVLLDCTMSCTFFSFPFFPFICLFNYGFVCKLFSWISLDCKIL
jgi:hypothetical protein